MKSYKFATPIANRVLLLTAMFIAIASVGLNTAQAGGKWNAEGMYVEGCSCMGVCPCELTGVKDGCQGVGAITLKSGSYNGADLSGAKIMYATAIGQWVRIYVDAKDEATSKAAGDFAKDFFASFGKVEAVKDAKINFSGKDGKYTVTVDDGNTLKFTSEPVLGGDNKTAMTHTNTKNLLSPTMMQGKTLSASYKDGERSMTLEGSNSFYNPRMKSKGTL